jgi:hypothetical protein
MNCLNIEQCAESIEWFIEDHRLSCGRTIRLLFHPLPPSPVSKLILFFSLFVCRRSSLLMVDGGGGGAKSCDREKAWSSISQSILSGTVYIAVFALNDRDSFSEARRLWYQTLQVHFSTLYIVLRHRVSLRNGRTLKFYDIKYGFSWGFKKTLSKGWQRVDWQFGKLLQNFSQDKSIRFFSILKTHSKHFALFFVADWLIKSS